MKKKSPQNYRHSKLTLGCLSVFIVTIIVGPILVCSGLLPLADIAKFAFSGNNRSESKENHDQAAGSRYGGDGNSDALDRMVASDRRGRRAGGRKKPQWTNFDVVRQTANNERVTAGRKNSITYDVRVGSQADQLPTRAQLAEIANSLESSGYVSTRYYFYLPGMKIGRTPWATARIESGQAIRVNILGSK